MWRLGAALHKNPNRYLFAANDCRANITYKRDIFSLDAGCKKVPPIGFGW